MKSRIVLVLIALMILVTGCSRKLHIFKKKEKDNHITVKIDSASITKVDSSIKLTVDSSITVSHKTTTGEIKVPGSDLDLFGFHLNDTGKSDTTISNGDVDVDIHFNPITKKLDVQTKVKPKTIPVKIDQTDTTFNHKTTLEKTGSGLTAKINSYNFVDSTKTINSKDKVVTHGINWTMIIIISIIILILIIAFYLAKRFKLL